MHFDLISDIHENYWNKDLLLNFKGLGTSLVAVIAGDVSNDWDYTFKRLVEISQHYKHVIFVDGNHEHHYSNEIWQNCQKFQDRLSNYNNITFLYKTCIVLDDTVFVGMNGWWTYDFCEPEINSNDCWDYLAKTYDENYLKEIYIAAKSDANIVLDQVRTFNSDPRINNIVVVTHTAPLKQFRYIPSYLDFNHMGRAGNSYMTRVLKENTNKKIKVWCFGHVHRAYDETIDGIRFVCNPRGREDENFGKIYYPKLISF